MPLPARTHLARLAALLSLAALAACGDATAPARGRLIVPVAPLRADATPAVSVTGPDGAPRQVVATDTLDGIAPGTYVVEAADVVVGDTRLQAEPARQEVVVTPGSDAQAAPVRYVVASARLAVAIEGLPAGAAARVTVTGPAGFSRALAAGDTLHALEPGSYTVAAGDVEAAGRTWRAAPASQAVQVATHPGGAEARVWYGAGTGTLHVTAPGVPPGVAAAVTVRGPGGFARTVAAPATLRHLEPGTYTATGAPTGADLVTYRAPGPASVALAAGEEAAAAVAYASAPLELALAPAADGLAFPLFLTAPAGDARLFVVERGGRVRVVKDGALLAAPFIDVTTRVDGRGERGLLGMAFDPDYGATGVFYLYYVALDGRVVVERFASAPGADEASGSLGIVLAIAHGKSEHHGGMLEFGPDGMLYVAPGDGGCCGDPNNNAQNLGTLLGKVLRIDPRGGGDARYLLPPGNPYPSRPETLGEIWASGLRSPWRFSFDPPAGLLYLADVGENSREEVNIVPASVGGLNFGWRRMEASLCFVPATGCAMPGLTLPAVEYGRGEGCSVIGGYVYRGADLPELVGRYLYSDFCRGWLRSLVGSAGSATERREWAGVSLPYVTSFGRDGRGELYMLAGGRAMRIVRR